MKIVHIEDFFHPEAGYQLNLLSKYQALRGHKVVIITAEIESCPDYLTSFFGKKNIDQKDNLFSKSYNVKIIRMPIWTFYSGRAIFKECIFDTVEDEKPDLLYIHNNTSYIGIRYTLKIGKVTYPIIFDCHMLEMASENRFSSLFTWFYRKFITPIIIKSDTKVLKVVNDNYLKKILDIPEHLTPLSPLATDREHFQFSKEERKNLREQHGISEDDFVITYTGKLYKSKGSDLLCEAIKDKIDVEGKKVFFLVVGKAPNDEFGKGVEQGLSNSENTIIRYPTQPYTELPKFYSMSDCAVFPKQCSMSFFDMQAIGLPVILEDIEINRKRIEYGNGLLFNPGDTQDLRRRIKQIASLNKKEFYAFRENALSYSKTHGSDYGKVVEDLDAILREEISQKVV